MAKRTSPRCCSSRRSRRACHSSASTPTCPMGLGPMGLGLMGSASATPDQQYKPNDRNKEEGGTRRETSAPLDPQEGLRSGRSSAVGKHSGGMQQLEQQQWQ